MKELLAKIWPKKNDESQRMDEKPEDWTESDEFWDDLRDDELPYVDDDTCYTPTSHSLFGAVPSVGSTMFGAPRSTLSTGTLSTGTVTYGNIFLTGGGGGSNSSNSYSVSSILSPSMTASTSLNVAGDADIGGDARINGDIKLNGRSLTDVLDGIEQRLAILKPSVDLEDKWEELKALGDKYRELEKEITKKELVWDILKK